MFFDDLFPKRKHVEENRWKGRFSTRDYPLEKPYEIAVTLISTSAIFGKLSARFTFGFHSSRLFAISIILKRTIKPDPFAESHATSSSMRSIVAKVVRTISV